MADTSHKMDANPPKDVLPHESHTLNPKKQDPQETVISPVKDSCEDTESISSDRDKQIFGTRRRSVEDTRSLNEKGVESDDSHELSFGSDISVKNKHLLGVIKQSSKRHSSLSSLCNRINLLNLEDEDSFENNTRGNVDGDELISNGNHEDIEEYFPATTIISDSSGEFLPAVSTFNFDEQSVTTEGTKECEQLFIKDTGTVVKGDKIISTDDVCDIDKVDVISTVDSSNQNSVVELSGIVDVGETENSTDSASTSSDSVKRLDETVFVKKSEEPLNIQTENIGITSPGLSIKFSCLNTSLKQTSYVREELPSIEISDVGDIKKDKVYPEADSIKTPEISPSKLLEISVNASPNELDKTTSCIHEDDLSFNDSSSDLKHSEDQDIGFKNSSNIPKSSGSKIDKLDSTFTANSDTNTSSNTTLSDAASPIKIETQCLDTTFNSNDKNVSITASPKAAVISDCIGTEDTCGYPIGVPEVTNSEEISKHTQIITVSQSTLTEFPGVVSVSQSTDTRDLTESLGKVGVSQSAFSDIISVSQGTNTDDSLISESEEKIFGPDTNSNFKMSDMVEKLNLQQAEISDLKLKLNAAQQHNASLELQIRQNEEIVIKTQAEALRTEQNYQQEVKQLKQKINENSKLIEKDRIRELEEQLKETKAREAKLLTELAQRTKDDVNYQKIMDQYEITMKSRIAETKRLQEENETIKTHLTNLELAFSDVHSKYEKTKASLQGVKANEETLLQDLELAQATNIQHEERYESLKAHARNQIEKSNKEIHDLKEQHDLEYSKLRAFSRRLEIKVSSLEVSLQQKTAECEQLSNLCDEVTGKKV